MLYDFGFLTIWLLDDVEATLQAGQAATVGREYGGGSIEAVGRDGLDGRRAIVVVAEGLVLLVTPDILLQTRVVDEGVAVGLNAKDGVVASGLFFADRVNFCPFHQ